MIIDNENRVFYCGCGAALNISARVKLEQIDVVTLKSAKTDYVIYLNYKLAFPMSPPLKFILQ